MNSLRTTDSRPYFERAFQEGIRRKIITQETVARIIHDGPDGIIQLAQAFGNVFKRSGLQEGQTQFVELISFYLRYTFGDHLAAGAQEIEKTGLLELSRKGSGLIKNMAKYPEFAVFEREDTKAIEYEAFFRKFERYQSRETYNQELERRKNNLRLRAFCIKLHEESGFEWDEIIGAEEAIMDELFLKVITGKHLPFESEVAFHNGKYQHERWDNLLGNIPSEFHTFKVQYSFKQCFNKLLQKKKLETQVEDEQNTSRKIDAIAWRTRFEGKKIGNYRVARGILSAYFLDEIKENISDEAMQEIILKARKDYTTIDELITAFHNSIKEASIQGTLALEGIESTWGKYVLNDAIPLGIAVNRLKKALRIPEEKLK